MLPALRDVCSQDTKHLLKTNELDLAPHTWRGRRLLWRAPIRPIGSEVGAVPSVLSRSRTLFCSVLYILHPVAPNKGIR
jgi:hypothetical protein